MADKPRTYSLNIPRLAASLTLRASTTVEAGDAVSRDSSGDLRPLNTGDSFAGFAQTKSDNSSGAAGDIEGRIWQRGEIELSVATANDQDDVGAAVYATDQDTFTLVSSSGLQIGKVTRYISGTTCRVYFEGLAVRSI